MGNCFNFSTIKQRFIFRVSVNINFFSFCFVLHWTICGKKTEIQNSLNYILIEILIINYNDVDVKSKESN